MVTPLQGERINWLMGVAYNCLPISWQAKQRLINFIYQRFGRLFKDTIDYQRWLQEEGFFRQYRSASQPPKTKGALTELVSSIRLERSPDPLVSILVPTYGKVNYTAHCLKSIEDSKPRVPYEVIVVDDACPDAELALLDQVEGITVVKNETNLGFIRSCNKAADGASGRFLLFLNNDTHVLNNWLESMVELFEAKPDAGIVGSKLIYPDGRLQ